MTKKKKAVLHVLSHTHWDREWYQPFQGYRKRLVFQMDNLLDLLEECPEYNCFHLDGQTACLLDYLEIRPENRSRVEKMIKDGRIVIGPWFVMPDEFLVSGESLIRNLLLGDQICKNFSAEPMPLGYVTDIFGHCSQLPQILKGFGIDTVMLHRGVLSDGGKSEMLWDGADGTSVLLIRVYPETGYQDFYMLREWSDEKIQEYEKKKLAMANSDVLYALDGNDHTAARKSVLDTISRVNGLMSKTRCIHSSVSNFLGQLKKSLKDSKVDLEKVSGELRTPNKNGAYADVFSGTSSSRVDLKQDNDCLEYLLARTADPFHVWGIINGGDSQKSFLNLAWRYLLLNHPHDSIVGCSIDQVHQDMKYRFDQARILAEDCIWESLQAIEKNVNTCLKKETDFSVTVFNPSQKTSTSVSHFSFEIRSKTVAEMRRKGLVPVLLDEAGKPCYHELLEAPKNIRCRPFITKQYSSDAAYVPPRHEDGSFDRYHVIACGEVPPLGYRSWGLSFMSSKNATESKLSATISPVTANAAKRSLENEYILLKVRSNGCLDIFDKTSGIWYKNMHCFEDTGDCGHGWNHIYPQNDTMISSKNETVSIKTGKTGKLKASLIVNINMRIPESLSFEHKKRKQKKIAMPISSEISLTAGSKRIEFRTTLRNAAVQHRLRVLFPTDINTNCWYGDTAFDMVKRNIKLPDTTGWKEKAREEAPIKNFAVACNETAGLAVMGKGLCEGCVQNTTRKTIAITLFRSFIENLWWEKTSDSCHEGYLSFEYAILPFSVVDKNYPSRLFYEVDSYKLPLYSITSRPHPGPLNSLGNFIRLEGLIVLSTIKLSEDNKAVIVRIFNPNETQTSGYIEPMFPAMNAYFADFLENPGKILASGRTGFHLALQPKQIATIRINHKNN